MALSNALHGCVNSTDRTNIAIANCEHFCLRYTTYGNFIQFHTHCQAVGDLFDVRGGRLAIGIGYVFSQFRYCRVELYGSLTVTPLIAEESAMGGLEFTATPPYTLYVHDKQVFYTQGSDGLSDFNRLVFL